MDIAIISLLAVYPFGQLPGIFGQNLLGLSFRAHILDVIVFFTLGSTLIVNRFKLNIGPLRPLLSVLVFGAIYSVFAGNFDLLGLLYFARLVVYLLFFRLISLGKLGRRRVVPPALVLVGVAISFFGWIQYIFLPDLTGLKYSGWDDHYYRLVSTFLDPAFTGILLVLACLAAAFLWINSKSRLSFVSLGFVMLSLGFTYSRASFAALVVGFFVLFWKTRKRLLAALVVSFLILITVLPRSAGGEGVKLMRTSSVEQKIENYRQGFWLISSNPLLGTGYNNLCLVKMKLGGGPSKQANSCYGLDNSFLFLWATTGILGLIAFGYYALDVWRNAGRRGYDGLFKASGAAVLFHAFFTNTLFYPWVIVWVAFLASISRTRECS